MLGILRSNSIQKRPKRLFHSTGFSVSLGAKGNHHVVTCGSFNRHANLPGLEWAWSATRRWTDCCRLPDRAHWWSSGRTNWRYDNVYRSARNGHEWFASCLDRWSTRRQGHRLGRTWRGDFGTWLSNGIDWRSCTTSASTSATRTGTSTGRRR